MKTTLIEIGIAIYFFISGIAFDGDFGNTVVERFLFAVFWLPFIALKALFELLGKTWTKGFCKIKLLDLASAYTVYVIFHRWNKLSERSIEFIKENYDYKEGLRKRVFEKIIKINSNPL